MSVNVPAKREYPLMDANCAAVKGFSELLTSIGIPTRPASASPANALSTPKPAAPPHHNPAPGNNISKVNGSSVKQNATAVKRKAEDGDSTGPPSKIMRKDGIQSNTSRGTGSAATVTASERLLPSTASKSQPKSADLQPNGHVKTSSTSAGGAAKPSITGPTPGSYAEKLARAKAAQVIRAPVPPPPKPVSQLTSRERREREAQIREAKLASKKGVVPGSFKQKASSSARTGLDSANKSSASKGAKELPAKIKKPRVDLGYSGTARPASGHPVVKNPSSSGPDKRTPPDPKTAFDKSRGRYTYYSEEEDESDGQASEEDDASDDMQGGGFDELMEEEEQSLRAARKEDAQALAEESAHRREKLERKRKLEALAAARAKKR